MIPLAKSGLMTSDLLHEQCFPHSVEKVEVIETHISWVVLTGPFAYKIKKPIQLAFVDYSTPKKRLHYCQLELELNLIYAPTIYLDVIPISLIGNEIRFEDDRNIVEYAVKMRQFEQSAILVNQLENLDTKKEKVDDFAKRMAFFHRTTKSSIESNVGSNLGRFGKVGKSTMPYIEVNRGLGSAEQVNGEVLENVRSLVEEFHGTPFSDAVNRLKEWTKQGSIRLHERLDARRRNGCVRRCHGDMHLKNLLYHQGKIVPFDCIEFNEKFQWIDVASDLAFPVMDFAARGKPNLAWRLLNQYLETTGDYDALHLMDYYLIYRALIRAKVGWLNPKNHVKGQERQPWGKYLGWSEKMISRKPIYLAITHGFSASGKSTEAMRLVEKDGAIRIRSDVVRDSVLGGASEERYSAESRQAVYDRLLEGARGILESGWSVVVDATFLKRSNREQFLRLAESRKIFFRIVDCEAPIEHLKKRIAARKNDPSEADASVIDFQLANNDPLTQTESTFCR